jgi:hypothetical protein
MKTMTCRQLGGPCDHQHHGENADEVIQALYGHILWVRPGGDTAHEPAHKEMKGRWRRARSPG